MVILHSFPGLSQNFIPADGPEASDILFVGESPGKDEDESTPPRPFVGMTGKEFDHLYLPMAGLRRREVRVTNLLPFHPYANRDPAAEEILAFERLLIEEIEHNQPQIIAPMGAVAVRWFLEADLHTVHGLPHTSSRAPNSLILPCHHPAAGLHNSEFQPFIAYDFQQIALALSGNLPPRPADPFPSPTYAYIELTTEQEVAQALNGVAWDISGIDTEGYERHPWGLSFSVTDGVAYVIRAASVGALKTLDLWLQSNDVLVILHNALHDLPILRELGVRVRRFEDTMVLSYCLSLEPQGLKDLAYRRCGMRMRSYEDVTGPAMQKITAEYLVRIAGVDWGLEEPAPERESDMQIRYRQPKALHKRAMAAVNDIFGLWTGTIIGNKRGGSSRLKEMGVRVGKVDRSVKDLPKIFNAWHCEVPIPVKPALDALYGEYIFELKPPEPPQEPADAIKRWKAMEEDLEESVQRAQAAVGLLPIVGLDAIEDQQTAIEYSARDADATRRVYPSLRQSVELSGMTELANLDMAVLPYMDCMQSTGILVDTEYLLQYGNELAADMRRIQEKIKNDVGIWINPSSGQQVAMLIYDILGFQCKTRTATGQPSTNDKALEAMAMLHPSIKDITDYRELHKLRNTYCVTLPQWVGHDGRLRTKWKYTRVSSGRVSTSDPNLLAIPIRTPRGNAIRRGFLPAPGRVFFGVDLSQIEMRVLAHLCRDENLIRVFRAGMDLHSATAARMWKCEIEEIEAEHKGLPFQGKEPDLSKSGGMSRRSSAKNVGFGIVYSISGRGLQDQMKAKTGMEYTEDECQSMINLYLDTLYPGVRRYMERQKYLCRCNNYVESLHGRRRYLPGVHSSMPRIREESFRQAINHPVQATAAEIAKLAMLKIWNECLPLLWNSGVRILPILFIHDELCFETDESAAEEAAIMIKACMESAINLCVPIEADYHISKTAMDGGSWADLK